jgi:hypothetical protein
LSRGCLSDLPYQLHTGPCQGVRADNRPHTPSLRHSRPALPIGSASKTCRSHHQPARNIEIKNRRTAMSFSSIPILDLSLARDPQAKPTFLESLRTALLEVGFLYIKNTGIDEALIQDVVSQGKAFFDLPEEKKLEIQMKNVPSFLGMTSIPQSPAIVQLTLLPQAITNSATK